MDGRRMEMETKGKPMLPYLEKTWKDVGEQKTKVDPKMILWWLGGMEEGN